MGGRLLVVRNVLKGWALLIGVCGTLGLIGWGLGGYRLLSIFVFCAALRLKFANVAEHFPFMSLLAIPAQQASSCAKRDEAANRLVAINAKAVRFIRRKNTSALRCLQSVVSAAAERGLRVP